MKITGGNREWFKDAFEQHFDYIRKYLYYLSGDIMLTEDLVQDVFLQLWEKRDSVKNETISITRRFGRFTESPLCKSSEISE